ncbi:hypothetical protein K469DRAFT_697697 [Zopfia rhizophila CBS 207.26]|uniref:Uncharacterized protein n=1 Tax=Zopfia rhizophila CBS 207.26 TaxID=1314779 RepID=A0A6A6EEG3_9PEZI|nr:hypothetical protein K469DRAFT_697697 [Zopfia rhizophila CBS 207.26]
MDSADDLLRLPTDLECQTDRHYNYSDGQVSKYLEQINRFHYDNISRIRLEIGDHNNQILRLSKGANAQIRLRPIQASKSHLVRELQVLESGWAKIVPIIRSQSLQLLVLPRELREKIYSYLYTKSETICLEYPDIDVRRSMLPRDPYLYLNASISDPTIAAEAARVLYDSNTFEVFNCDEVNDFLATDHYGSRVLPRDILRRIHMSVSIWGLKPSVSSHIDYEEQFRKYVRRYGGYGYGYAYARTNPAVDAAIELRRLSPLIKILRSNNMAVKFMLERDSPRPHKVDISKWFEEPSIEDLEAVQRDGKLRIPEYRMGLEIPGQPEPTPAQYRVFLDEHYRVFRRLETEEKTELLVKAKKNIDAIFKALECNE